MTEIAVTQNPEAQPGPGLANIGDTGNGTDLQAWVSDLGNAYTLAERICRTPFAPKDFQGKPEAAAVAILHGKSLGLDPLASMSSIFVVSGRPGLYSKAMHAIVLAAGHQVWVESESAQEVVVKGKRRGSETVSTSRWTPERAQKAGYFSNAKYKTEPIAMLRARAIGDVCRVVAPDVLAGLAYNEADVAIMDPLEDLGEGATTTGATPAEKTAVPATAKVAVKRRQAPAPELPDVVNNAPVDTVEQEPEVVDGPEMMSAEQWTHLSAALMGAGHKTKAAMGTAIEEQLNRATGGPDDITAQEASDLLAFFTAETGAPAALDPEADAAWLAGAK